MCHCHARKAARESLSQASRSKLASGNSSTQPRRQAIEIEIDDWRRKERQDLAHDEPADDGYAERVAGVRACASPEHQRHRTENRGKSRHQDRAKSQQTRLKDSLLRCDSNRAFSIERKV